MPNKKDLIIDIKTKLQFCTTISIFLIGVLQFFFNIYDNTFLHQALNFIMIPVFYLVSYVLFDVRKNKLDEKSLKFINLLIVIGISAFVFPLIQFAVGENNLYGLMMITLFQSSILIMLLIPFVICIFLFLHIVLAWTMKKDKKHYQN